MQQQNTDFLARIQTWGKTRVEGIQRWVEANPQRAGIYAVVVVGIILGFIFQAPPPHVALSGEPIFSTGPAWFTNSILTTIIVDLLLIGLAFLTTSRMNLVPGGLQNAMEAIIEYLYNLAESVAGKNVKRFFPISATLFFFVLFSNYSGLIPSVGSLGFYHPVVAGEHGAAPADSHGTEAAPAEGGEVAPAEGGEEKPATDAHSLRLGDKLAMNDGGVLLLAPAAETTEDAGHGEKFVPLFRAPSADLNTTFALSLITMLLVQYFGFKDLGSGYTRKFWNPSGTGAMKGVNIFVGILELVSEISRILSFAFRLFGNIFAGEVVLATMAFLCAYLIPVPFYLLELLVGAVQALVFMMLSLVFFSMAVVSHGDHSHDEAHAEHH